MQPIVEVTNLEKKFKDLTAVNNLSFTVNPGDVYGFLGQNGAGKSTTIRMLLTLITPTNGSIKIFGKELAQNRREILSQTGAIIEKPDLYKYLSAIDNLELFARLSGLKLKKTELLKHLQNVGLEQRATSKVKTFSQGMKQRLGIAIALVHNPQLIILDEPTNGLDPQGIADMRNLITGLSKNQGKTVIVSSHLLSEIQQIANRILIIHNGQKITEAATEELVNPAKSIVTIKAGGNAKSLIEQSNFAAALKEYANNEYVFEVSADKQNELLKNLLENEVQVESFNQKNSLENYFLNLIK
jgi:ABC-type multidrug transport system ATPase subunit